MKKMNDFCLTKKNHLNKGKEKQKKIFKNEK